MGATGAFASVVMIVKLSITSRLVRFLQTSHSPAISNSPPSFMPIQNGCFGFPGVFRHSYNPPVRTRQRRAWNADEKAGFSRRDPARALIIRLPIERSLAQDGI